MNKFPPRATITVFFMTASNEGRPRRWSDAQALGAADDLLQLRARLPQTREEHEGANDERLVARFVVGRDAVLLEDFSADLAGLAAHVRDVGRQAVHVQR